MAAIKVLEQEGGPDTLYSTLQCVGITTFEHPAAYYGLGLTIGNGEVRLLELTNAYAALARLGVYKPFQLLTTSENPVGTSSCSSEGCSTVRTSTKAFRPGVSDERERVPTGGIVFLMSERLIYWQIC